jgi:beta-N-acetylhexosaminidase
MRKFILPVLIGFLFLLSNSLKSAELESKKNARFIPKDTTWKSLSIREKIGQTMVMLPDRKAELKLGNGTLDGFFKNYPVGAFFMGYKLFDGVKSEDRTEHLRKAVVEYQQASRLPLIMQEDYETGLGLPGMTAFPREMSIGATNNEKMAYQYGEGVAMESRSVGVNWVLHPVCDLNLNPFNPIANTRSISDNPDKAIRLLKQQVSGLQQNGVAATIKHFPGDGVDYRDQHLLTSCNSLSKADWDKTFGKVYSSLIQHGVACIMPGHISLPAYQKTKINGFYPPATLSHELLTDLLKGKLGFKGVIVSDALVMAGFRGYYKSNVESEIKSFEAGVDMMLWPSYEFMDSVEMRIKRGEIPISRLNDAVQRVWAMKERFGLLKKDRELIKPISADEISKFDKVAQDIADNAITLVRDTKKLLPLNPAKKEKILMVGMAASCVRGNYPTQQIIKLQKELIAKGFNVDFQSDILYERSFWSDELTNKYDKVIFVANRYFHYPPGPLQFWDNQAQTVWCINSTDKSKVIFVSLGSPYHTNEYFERVSTIINAYSCDDSTIRSVAKALSGELIMTGTTPVNLNLDDVFDMKARIKNIIK